MFRKIRAVRLAMLVAVLLAGPAVAVAGGEAAASAASPAASAPSTPSPAPVAASSAPECPGAELVFKRVREAAKLNAAEANLVEGGGASQAGEVASNLLGFGGLFNAASSATRLSAHKKIADAIAADPCGDRALEGFPKAYRALYEAYQRQRKP